MANPRIQLVKPFYPGTLQDSKYDMEPMLQKTHFDRIELDALFEQYKSLAMEDGIPRQVFDLSLGPLGLEKNLISERIFCFFDQNLNGFIDFEEFAMGLSVLCKGSLDEKIKAAFHGYDISQTGKISKENLHSMFKAYFHLSMNLVRDVVKAMEEEMMETFDDDNNKPVSAAFSAPIPASEHHTKIDDDITIDTRRMSWMHAEDPLHLDSPKQPVMEIMSQEAISEMVDKAFIAMQGDDTGYVDFESFKKYVETDCTLISWFETLGSVF